VALIIRKLELVALIAIIAIISVYFFARAGHAKYSVSHALCVLNTE
jgi:hypothetical protein